MGPVARLACNVCCFIYPAYASYKALSLPNTGPRGQPQGNGYNGGTGAGQVQGLGDETIERWLMYWSVVGLWTAVETTVGWTFTWIPFYSLAKLLIFLYFSLPQTQGSSMVYHRFLAPAFAEHEADIDAALVNLRSQATSSLTDAVGYIWRLIAQRLNAGPQQDAQPYQIDPNTPPHPSQQNQYPAPPAPPPSFQDPAGGAAQKLYGFLGRYAGQYLPVAATALQAAAAAAVGSRPLSNADAQAAARQVHETLQMPVPYAHASSSTAGVGGQGGSRTMMHAQGQGGETSARAMGLSAEGLNARGGGMRNASSGSFSGLGMGHPGLAHHDSNGSNSSRSSFSGLGMGHPGSSGAAGGQGQGWGGDMSSYESISHADVPAGADVGYHVGGSPGAKASPQRPDKRRTSSWFGRGSDDREKTE